VLELRLRPSDTNLTSSLNPRKFNLYLEYKLKKMDSNHNFFEAMKLVTALSKEQQDRFISEIRQFQRDNVFEQLQVGAIVKINHKKVDPTAQFRVTKINRKNVKVKQLNGNNVYSVGASLLEVVK